VAGDNGDKSAAKTIRWENRDDGIFRIMDPEQLAQQWGIRKQNKEMTYDKLSRALRSVTNWDFSLETDVALFVGGLPVAYSS